MQVSWTRILATRDGLDVSSVIENFVTSDVLSNVIGALFCATRMDAFVGYMAEFVADQADEVGDWKAESATQDRYGRWVNLREC